jgi:hypothetical protein
MLHYQDNTPIFLFCVEFDHALLKIEVEMNFFIFLIDILL